MEGTTSINKSIWKKLWFWLIIIILIGFTSGCNDNDSEKDKVATTTQNFSLNFNPEIKTIVEEGKITINANLNCPDGAIMQVMVISGDLKEVYTDKPIVKDGKISSVFNLKNTNIKTYSGSIMLQFNADTVVQPENVKLFYGNKGEKLEGDNAKESVFRDKSKGKNGYVIFDIPYPSQEAVDEKIAVAFKEIADQIVNNSGEVILSLERTSPRIFEMQVSNTWYLSTESEKQYFAEEMLKNLTKISKSLDGDARATLTIFDESMNTVASSKMMGGMEIES